MAAKSRNLDYFGTFLKSGPNSRKGAVEVSRSGERLARILTPVSQGVTAVSDVMKASGMPYGEFVQTLDMLRNTKLVEITQQNETEVIELTSAGEEALKTM